MASWNPARRLGRLRSSDRFRFRATRTIEALDRFAQGSVFRRATEQFDQGFPTVSGTRFHRVAQKNSRISATLEKSRCPYSPSRSWAHYHNIIFPLR